jgi:cell division protein FtsI (penicillin-binding protein 3)/stage V sporulation protein D (sporulation-specific penicillin-binding protein)
MNHFNNSPQKIRSIKLWRVNLILIFFISLWLAIIGKLFLIQVIRFDLYNALAQGQQKFMSQFQGERGQIFLNDGEKNIPLAINKTWSFCYVSPNEIKDKEETADNLSKILSLEKNEIPDKINSQNEESLFLVLKQKLNEEEISEIKKINLPGVYIAEENLRDYPQDFLASNVVGFLGGEGKGQYGVEGYFNDILEGQEVFVEGEKGSGLLFLNSESLLSQKGSDILLTIDYNVQFMAEKLLKEAKDKLEFKEGEIVVMDPNSGKIIALSQFPSFNPNSYSEEKNLDVFQDSAIQKIFEPGSVFKPITMAAALEEEKITPQTTYTDPGVIRIGGWPIYNYDQRTYPGKITMTEVLEKSINTGAVFAERQLGNDLFLNYINKFALFEKTGIDLQGEIFSQNKELKKGYEVNFATAAFGQGIEITPIQLVRAYGAIANGGRLVKPYVVDKIFKNGEISQTQPVISSPIVSKRTADQLAAMLVSVIENGFGKAAKIPGYYIAGKTGTAQVSWASLGVDKRGYSNETIQTFAGFAPAFNPKFVILVKLNNPNTKTAEYSAVPIFRELAKYIIDLWQIPPDYE